MSIIPIGTKVKLALSKVEGHITSIVIQGNPPSVGYEVTLAPDGLDIPTYILYDYQFEVVAAVRYWHLEGTGEPK